MLRILIVDDQKSIRETLATVLTSEPDFTVVGAAHNGDNALKLAREYSPDLMLVDLEMPGVNGLKLTRIIHQDFPSIKVIVLSMHDQDSYIQEALQAGAMGYLLKNTPAKDLTEAIRFVARGYTQFSPGLLHKVIAPQSNLFPRKSRSTTANLSLAVAENSKSVGPSDRQLGQPRYRRKSWRSFLPYWLLGNAALLGMALLYLGLKSPTYTSKWAISLPSRQNSSSVSIPDVGSVSSNSESPYRNSLFDPREDYKFLARKKEILTQAAQKVGMKRQEYGKPEIEIVDNTTMMELSVEGDTPQEAQQKAIALQEVIEQKIQQLRDGQISQTDRNLQASLEKSQSTLEEARAKLANFRNSSALGARDKAGNLSANLEELRRQAAEAEAQLQQSKVQVQRLADNLGMSTDTARDAFALHSDSLFQQYLAEYTRLSGELVTIEAKYQSDSPNVVGKLQEVAQARQLMLERGGNVLQRTPSPQLLEQLNLSTGNENNSYRGSLLQDIVSLQSESDGLAAKSQELARQVQQLETKEQELVQQDTVLSKLQKEVKFAETVYSSNLAKSRLAESNLYDAYPQIQVAIQPNVPEKPSSPDPSAVTLGTLMASIFLTTALTSWWATSKEAIPALSQSQNNHNHRVLASSVDLKTLLKK
ncbi:MAG: response regulator [Cyanobacteria bacterium J06623_7]